MIKRTLAAAAVLMLASAPAFASHCPKDVKAIDAALGMHPKLTSAQMSEVKALRDKGEMLHKSGKHAASIEELHKAMKILGIQH